MCVTPTWIPVFVTVLLCLLHLILPEAGALFGEIGLQRADSKLGFKALGSLPIETRKTDAPKKSPNAFGPGVWSRYSELLST